ncbi:MAG: DNA primase [Thermodesulfovibrionales bacterium]
MKNDRVLEEIKSRIDIVDLVSGYVSLKKAGQNWKGLCPFHTEKTPSFTVNPARQIFHCFGCSTGGDAISFVMKAEGISFVEALKMLAEKAGVPLKLVKADPRTLQREEQVRNVLQSAAAFFGTQLKASAAARGYLEKRGVSAESVSAFRLGFAPAGWSNLIRHLRGAGYADDIVREAGLAVAGDKGLYDMFRQRLIFPITSTGGQVIAFGGRAMDDSPPKYINSPETAVFRKSETLYGLSEAKEAIRSSGRAVLVEGYLDVIICHQHGIRNAVAPLGTALTSGHLQRLRSLAAEAVLVFDGDTAGLNAARRAVPLLCRQGFAARIALLPAGEDPDSFLAKHGRDSFIPLLDRAASIVAFLAGPGGGPEAETARRVLSVIAEHPDPLAAEEMLIELAGRTNIHESVLRAEFRKLRGKVTVEPRKPYNRQDDTAARTEERILLGAVIAFPGRLPEVLARIDPDSLGDRVVASLLKRFAEAGERTLPEVAAAAPPEELTLFNRLAVDPGFDLSEVDRNIEDCLGAIERKRFDERIRMAQRSGDVHALNALLAERKNRARGKDA